MANELTVSASLNYTKLGTPTSVSVTKQMDINAGARINTSQKIGTSEESVAMVDVVSVRYIFVQNLDITNYVEVGAVTGSYPIKLFPGDFALFPPNSNTLFLKANTAVCMVDILAVNA